MGFVRGVGMDLDHAVEGTLAKAIAAFGVPALITVVGILGGIVLTDMRTSLQRQGSELTELSGDLREMKATLDGGLMWRINELERRLNVVEDNARKVGVDR